MQRTRLQVLDADGDGGLQDLLVDSCLPPPRDRLRETVFKRSLRS